MKKLGVIRGGQVNRKTAQKRVRNLDIRCSEKYNLRVVKKKSLFGKPKDSWGVTIVLACMQFIICPGFSFCYYF